MNKNLNAAKLATALAISQGNTSVGEVLPESSTPLNDEPPLSSKEIDMNNLPRTVSIDVMAEWMQDMYNLLGVIIHKMGSRAVEVTPCELEKFKQTKAVSFSCNPNGTLRYTVDKLPKGKVSHVEH